MQNQEEAVAAGRKKSPYFRDTLSIEDESGRRKWIFPKRTRGRLTNYRYIVSGILIGVFFILPFIKVNGEPFFILNIFARKFIIFGQVFWPQDFHLLVLAIISLLVFIILFTVVYGRVFCGWACPQTLFMEFVFRQIEYLIEGDAPKQRKLAAQQGGLNKVFKKTLKHAIFILVALAISNVFLAYFIGGDTLGRMISAGPGAHVSSFLFMMIFGALIYFIFSWLREYACILICPYGRLQGVLLDDKTIVVAYDYKRGEPRAIFQANENRAAAGKGDCIDCLNCVQVCPTGIDIRNGTQLECINCTACIDACNSVMKRVKLPTGLIRYDSEKGISTGVKKIISARSVAYSLVLLVLLAVTTSLFILRSDVEATILRIPGSIYQEYGSDKYANIYNIQLVNKKRQDFPIQLELSPVQGEIIIIGDAVNAIAGKVTEANFMVVIPKENLRSSNTDIVINITSEGRKLSLFKTNFIGPASLDQN